MLRSYSLFPQKIVNWNCKVCGKNVLRSHKKKVNFPSVILYVCVCINDCVCACADVLTQHILKTNFPPIFVKIVVLRTRGYLLPKG